MHGHSCMGLSQCSRQKEPYRGCSEELGFFAPWSRTRARVWALTTSLTTLGYRFFPGVRLIVSSFLRLFG